MGTHGVHPSEDDDAFEFYTPIMDAVSKSLQKVLNRPLTTAKSVHYGGLARARAAALIVETLASQHMYNHDADVRLAVQRMKEVTDNKEVTADFRKASAKQAKRLQSLVRDESEPEPIGRDGRMRNPT